MITAKKITKIARHKTTKVKLIFVRKQNVRIKSETDKIKSETKTAFSLVKVLQPFDDKRLLPQKLAKGF